MVLEWWEDMIDVLVICSIPTIACSIKFIASYIWGESRAGVFYDYDRVGK